MINTEGTNGYLYSIWNGRLMVYEGTIHEIVNSSASVFGNKIKRFTCASKPGVVYNAVVWHETPDDNKARELLIEYEETAIVLLYEKIESHNAKIKLLKESN